MPAYVGATLAEIDVSFIRLLRSVGPGTSTFLMSFVMIFPGALETYRESIFDEERTPQTKQIIRLFNTTNQNTTPRTNYWVVI